MLKNNLHRTPTRPVLLSVWLNFTENGKHGCSKNCPFCNFSKNPVYMCPTESDLRDFLDKYSKYSLNRSVLLTGGGDPLYNFDKNADKIRMILSVCKEKGYEVVIQSGEISTINLYFDSFLKDISAYYFSSETRSSAVLCLAKKLKSAGKRVVISKVLNSSNNIEYIDYTFLDEWVAFYNKCCSWVLVHENYNCCFTIEENAALEKNIRERYCDYNARFVRYIQHRKTIDKFIGLVNDTVMWGQEFIFMNK